MDRPFNSPISYSEKFADLRFADWNTQKNLQICDCGINIKNCGFAIGGVVFFNFQRHIIGNWHPY
jgi:hypothetical protein